MAQRSTPDIVAGLLLLLAGLFVLVYATVNYAMGSAHRMGPGFYPAVLGIGTMLVSLLIVVGGFRHPGKWPQPAWRPAIFVCASVLAFMIGLSWLGMVPAVFLTVGVAALADPASRPLGTLVLAGFVTVFAWLIFSVGFGMPLPAFRTPL